MSQKYCTVEKNESEELSHQRRFYNFESKLAVQDKMKRRERDNVPGDKINIVTARMQRAD
jgi:hypothetical protein